MSRWFVGSSKINKCGACNVANIRESLAFCPPDKVSTLFSTISESIPKVDNLDLNLEGGSLGKWGFKCSKAVSLGIKSSI